MSGYDHRNDEFEITWDPNYAQNYDFVTNDGVNTNAELNFQSFDGYEQNVNTNYPVNSQDLSYLDPTYIQQDAFVPYSPARSENKQDEFEDEPPLLEELGIHPDKIFEKTLAALNPFHKTLPVDINLLYETDLAGPITLCMILGGCLLLTGGKAHFGYVYGLVMISCILMYILLTLMTTDGTVTFGSVASILGYCLLPVVILSLFGVFLSLINIPGFIFGAIAVLWSSLSASKLFVTMSSDGQQRPLIAYPCALLYGTFALVIIF